MRCCCKRKASGWKSLKNRQEDWNFEARVEEACVLRHQRNRQRALQRDTRRPRLSRTTLTRIQNISGSMVQQLSLLLTVTAAVALLALLDAVAASEEMKTTQILPAGAASKHAIPSLDLQPALRRQRTNNEQIDPVLPDLVLMHEDGEAYGQADFFLNVGRSSKLVWWTTYTADKEIVSHTQIRAEEVDRGLYNCSILVEADKMPGKTAVKLILYSKSGMRIQRHVITMRIKVYGLVLLSESKNTVASGLENQLAVRADKRQVALAVVWYFEKNLNARQLVKKLRVSVESVLSLDSSVFDMQMCGLEEQNTEASDEDDEEGDCVGGFKMRKNRVLYFLIWPFRINAEQIRMDISLPLKGNEMFTNVLFVAIKPDQA
ncbi:hypothetical protein FVE85_1489 [Porphyridium purpureum]|uniref:Uncharacterized protein n=1 Tax=Porphyridium purpureum TaxID=35688 RepID=A0A5J4YXD9_PORPP|nr:hypothetical protein FVE85_1489 [Porphyridium purpureum]|eukprot:POR0474..scf209_3